MKHLIAISLSPNTSLQDVFCAVSLIFSPGKQIKGESIHKLERWFCDYFGVTQAVSFASGRTALFAILKSLDIGTGDEVLLQAFTCVAVPNSVIWAGATPVYVDIDSSLTIDIKNLEKKITKKTKAIIVQHTFGIPTDMSSIQKIAKKLNIYVIEDCAHTIGGTYQNKKLGTYADASFFSFGRDKAFSSVFGGMVITSAKDLGRKIRDYQQTLSYPSRWWVIQQLLHPVAFSFILPVYTSGLGKLILVLFQKLHFLSFPVSWEEKVGGVRFDIFKKLPNALAVLALFQLKRMKEFNSKRQKISSFYVKELKNTSVTLPVEKIIPFLRFPILSERKEQLLNLFRSNNVYLGNWYSSVIDPKGVDFKKIFYTPGSCPLAESIATKVINLPTNPTTNISDAKRIISLLHQYVEN
ncbi:MAG: hypothetical protein A3F31_04575 [Candidatus Levybacteria bacterium RIFCSPHIGHO2_12_FULL_38_12]|nr:MAG: hypothetical protein A2770_04260 [Candidatus Levybacteria bacterium RIFCSPHIGHO2_01_FULL_38_12]OGH21815.1 MAG: hypothetical protein A3D75_01330 [Candidatus Levybacteria bacterium RIFCSPHIGHO2_02_FULL_37_18]OGH22528.1 MAG: hypothetical protein A3F31_04575 [Candidatus Levybacteria bacterium RIFCSPHIGHO2_12_FULL_38_12]OGH33436.1 MAG: hypothetical protein A3A47_04280 [Candidatus Levybacteria bacterium RIFCSPLOWO2_01_FULL_37_20]OGH44065.1 MAG: hypothetical protein A3J14_04945 [Candidatus Lev